MRILTIGDIHGGLKALLEVIEKVQLTTTDTLIFLGDYVDGWSESPEVLSFLIDLNQKHDCIFIRGNHDDLLLQYLKKDTYNEEWFKYGGQSTINAYKRISEETIQLHIAFLEKLQDYYIDRSNRLFIHAGFTNLKGVAFEYFKPLYYWDRTLWETALSLDSSIPLENSLYPNRFKIYKEIYIGHTPVTKIGETIPINKACVWNIDTGAAFMGSISILDVDTKEYWQSTPLHLLYPDEIGRN